MSRNISQFKFKQFAVSHNRSAMKVGVDGVLIGCWTDVEGISNILDVGTGCGLIALIMAQRCPKAHVAGIEIDLDSVYEAKENVYNSPWSDRINIIQGDFRSKLFSKDLGCFDLIVSNPPFFASGVTDIITSRERARHQGSLSPSILLDASKDILTPNGRLAMIVPSEISSELEEEAKYLGYSLKRKCLVRGHTGANYKRCLLQWQLQSCLSKTDLCTIECLTLESSPNRPTDEYRALCKDFYLKF